MRGPPLPKPARCQCEERDGENAVAVDEDTLFLGRDNMAIKVAIHEASQAAEVREREPDLERVARVPHEREIPERQGRQAQERHGASAKPSREAKSGCVYDIEGEG